MISCLGLCIVFGLTTTNCSVSNDIEQSPTPEQPKVAKYHNPIVSTSLPDPTVTKAGDGYFYLYATGDIRNLPIYRSKDLVNWNYERICLMELTMYCYMAATWLQVQDTMLSLSPMTNNKTG